MPRDPDQPAPNAVALDELMLDAKMSIPAMRRGDVSRSGLIAAGRQSRRPVIGVTAPAGYGKSTFLSQWAHSEDRQVIWVSLDRLDDDPSALLTVLASAFARTSPSNTNLVAEIGGNRMSALGRAAPRLAAVLRASAEPFVLILDDLQELTSPTCHDVLTVVISGIPEGSQFIGASRAEQAHLPRLRASGEVLEFNTSDLALDCAGAEQIFKAAHSSLSHESALTLVTKTEGWPVGLYLAALIARGDDGALTVSGDDPYVADYLYRESLSKLPEAVQRFLQRTAVLDQLCAPLCDAVVGEPGVAHERLRQLEALNLFLVPLDRRREWFRYHGLFREFLLGELRSSDPEEIENLHLRAADWYESQNSPETALEHLLHTGETERCVRLVTQLTPLTYQTGQISKLQRWLALLGDSAVASYPPLSVIAGWMAALTGHVAEAQRWASVIDAASFSGVPADGTASFASGRAMLRGTMCDRGPEQMLVDAKIAVEEEPSWSPWRDQALCLFGEANLLVGDIDEAWAPFGEASRLAGEFGNADIVALAEASLALLDINYGRWNRAAEHVETALTAIDDAHMDDYATSVLAFSAAARLAVQRSRRDEAEHQLTRGMRARPNLTHALPALAVRPLLHMAKAYWALGNHSSARHILREIDDVLLHRPNLGTLVDEVADLRGALNTLSRESVPGGSPLTPAEVRLLPYLQTHLTIREIATRLFVSRNTVSSQVGSIYRKLGVSSRHDAVERATAIGLLGG